MWELLLVIPVLPLAYWAASVLLRERRRSAATSIETVVALQALPVDTLLRDREGKPVILGPEVVRGKGLDLIWPRTRKRCATKFAAEHLPLTVLYLPMNGA